MNKDSVLFTPMKIGNCEIKNRIVMPPMHMGMGQMNGDPTETMMNYYEERAKGGTGLIIMEITRVNDKTGAAAFAQPSVSSDDRIPAFAEFAKRMHRHGAKVFIQLHHPGRQNVGLLVGTVPMSKKLDELTKGSFSKMLFKLTPTLAPVMLENNIALSAVAPSACEPAAFSGGKVRALSHDEILELEQQFIDGAIRVQKAGCDGVELHAAHGYLIQQFLSPVTNQRTDEYGGDLDGRMLFITNIINGIREKCGKDFPLIVRLSVDECYDRIGQPDKGYHLDEGVEIAKRLEALGVDAIDVSSGNYDTFNYWLEPVSFDLGWRKHMAKAVKDAVNIPVLAANLIRSPEQAEQQIEEGTQDFVSLGRPQIADPEWANKAQNGGTIRRCICCLNCIESMTNNAYHGGHGTCAVNPFVGHEKERILESGRGRKVVIIGAGPAGLTAAYILAGRKFDVTVLEKSDKLGGQLNLASAPPHKAKTAWLIEDLKALCDESGVKIVTSCEATAEKVAEYDPWAVICACGSSPVKPYFDGQYVFDDLITFEDVLNGKVVLDGKTVAVIGSGMTGLETTEFLNEKGCKTTVIEMAGTVAPGTWMQHVDDIMPRLKEAGTEILTGEKLSELYKDRIVIQNVKSGEKRELPVDATVLALGSTPNSRLVSEMKANFKRVFAIGDASKVGRIQSATEAAYNLAVKL